MKTAIKQWLNGKDKSIMYGIMVLHEDGIWYDAMEGKKPLLYATRKEANAKRKTIENQNK